MSLPGDQIIPKDKFLLIAMNLLHREFVASPRTTAKRLFKDILGGHAVQISKVQLEDNTLVNFSLALDQGEYRGKLNFGAFRAGLAALLGNISQALEEGRDVAVFNPEQRPESMLFGITGVTVEDDRPRVLVLGADVGSGGPAVTLRLMYLDHRQFSDREAAATG